MSGWFSSNKPESRNEISNGEVMNNITVVETVATQVNLMTILLLIICTIQVLQFIYKKHRVASKNSTNQDWLFRKAVPNI